MFHPLRFFFQMLVPQSSMVFAVCLDFQFTTRRAPLTLHGSEITRELFSGFHEPQSQPLVGRAGRYRHRLDGYVVFVASARRPACTDSPREFLMIRRPAPATESKGLLLRQRKAIVETLFTEKC